jgi:hypothetical protein
VRGSKAHAIFFNSHKPRKRHTQKTLRRPRRTTRGFHKTQRNKKKKQKKGKKKEKKNPTRKVETIRTYHPRLVRVVAEVACSLEHLDDGRGLAGDTVVRPRVVPKVPHLARLIAAAQLKLGRDVAFLAVACKVSRAIRKSINKSSRESVRKCRKTCGKCRLVTKVRSACIDGSVQSIRSVHASA